MGPGSSPSGMWAASAPGQAFPLCNIRELLFFAYFTEAPLIVPDDTTRALLCERGYDVLSAAR
jgi:hypothetical protein